MGYFHLFVVKAICYVTSEWLYKKPAGREFVFSDQRTEVSSVEVSYQIATIPRG